MNQLKKIVDSIKMSDLTSDLHQPLPLLGADESGEGEAAVDVTLSRVA